MRTMSALTISLFLTSAAAAQELHPRPLDDAGTAWRIRDAIHRTDIPPAAPPFRKRLPTAGNHARQPSYRPVRHTKSTRALAIGLGAFCGFIGGGLIGGKIDAYFTRSGKRGFLIGAPMGAVVGGLAGAELSR